MAKTLPPTDGALGPTSKVKTLLKGRFLYLNRGRAGIAPLLL
ncbi:hypothetical protein ROA7450_01889 [Roseovarius albus]|uniref:Uncharacterized protein n=1 Tax=Roseovarius albus TaxID=1247867 RepID=A0A1X6Z3T7_9RHOB|nr:hypothetical protein ROA7450_01889 [Roseovarius albus]